MRAFLLAAGLGTRLLPLSRTLPKPAWPLFDVPLAGHVLGLLARAGVTECIVNTHHLGERLQRALLPWVPATVQVRWSPEDPIQGTGGALRPWLALLRQETFLLANGDTYQELDLPALLARHRDSGSIATLSLRALPPGERGPITLGSDGRIVRFLDARAPGGGAGVECEFTGVHAIDGAVLEHLPAGPCCINADLHRRLVAAGFPLSGFLLPDTAFWSDLGTPQRYLEAHGRLLAAGRLPARVPGSFVGKDRTAAAGGLLVAPAYCGPGARVESGAVAGPHAVLGAGAVVAGGAVIRDAVIWSGARVGAEGADREIVARSGARIQVE